MYKESETEAAAEGAGGNHLALTVRIGSSEYFVDAGLGDGPYEPLPLREGSYRQGAFTYSLERPARRNGEHRPDRPGWIYRHPGSSAPIVSFRSEPASTADFEAEHIRLSTSEDSGFVRAFAALRRDADGIDVLRGRVLSRIDPAKGNTERVLETPEEFYATLTSLFARNLDDLTPTDRTTLWTRVTEAHEAWLATREA